MEFFATCSKGFERALGDELRAAGVQGVRPLRAGVTFHGEPRDAYRAMLWSRLAGRVLLTLARVKATDADVLYEGVKALPWHEHVALGKTIAVEARGTNDRLRNTRFTALKAKDAICDALVDIRGSRPDVDAAHPDVMVNVNVSRDKATISIDLSGTPLERRGYQVAGKAPSATLRESIAAGVLNLSGWSAQAAEQMLLFTPMCGDGSLAIEGALVAHDIAPGILRPHWGFEGWAFHDEAAWAALLDEADERMQSGSSARVRIAATDTDAAALEYARARAKRAGVADSIEFVQVGSAFEIPDEVARAQQTLLAVHMHAFSGSLAQAPALYAGLRSVVAECGASGLALVTPDSSADVSIGADPSESICINNAGEEETCFVFGSEQLAADERMEISVRGVQVRVCDQGAGQFAARLNKVAKQRRKWAKANNVFAYRVYDADLPDYNMAIDVYNGAGPDEGKRLVYVAEYAAPKEIDPAKTARRLADALAIIPVVFEIDPGNVFTKQRLRAKGGSQYAQDGLQRGASKRLITKENGLFFEVNLSDYLDTGLFLDHRVTRGFIAQLAKGKSFLNLFAYTGTASVYAAAAGAKFTTTVDLSNTYQDWARRNMELNGLMNVHQEFERADCIAWVNEKRHSKERWDLVFCDPPTYSNSAKMGKRTWDVQRDHAELLIGVSRLLTRGGAIVFSCNLRSFKPDTATLAKAGVQIVDITPKTIPDDFERHQRIHHCYLLRRTPQTS